MVLCFAGILPLGLYLEGFCALSTVSSTTYRGMVDGSVADLTAGGEIEIKLKLFSLQTYTFKVEKLISLIDPYNFYLTDTDSGI